MGISRRSKGKGFGAYEKENARERCNDDPFTLLHGTETERTETGNRKPKGKESKSGANEKTKPKMQGETEMKKETRGPTPLTPGKNPPPSPQKLPYE